MRFLVSASRLLASAVLLCMASAVPAEDTEKSALDDLKAAIEELKKLKQEQPQHTVNTNALAIESWLLTSTAIDATASKIHAAVDAQFKGKVLVLAGDEALDFNQVGMLRTEMQSLARRMRQASDMICAARSRGPGTRSFGEFVPLATAVAGLLKTDTELTAIDQTVEAKLLAASVAGKFAGRAIIPTEAIAADSQGPMIEQFKDLVRQADIAKELRDRLAKKKDPTECESQKTGQLTAALNNFDTFYARVTTATDKGAVPIVVAARLDKMLGENRMVLRVNTEKAGGTLLKRTNLLTVFGAETAFVSGGLVSSYQLTKPATGELVVSGVITCRTALTSLKRVQQGSWSSPERMALPNSRSQPLAVCFQPGAPNP